MRAPTMTRTFRAPALRGALLCLAAAAGCAEGNPAEVRDDAPAFPVRASWSASAAPVGTGTVRGTFAAKEHLGSRIETTLTLTGAPNTSYQWRIFRGDCATNTAASGTTAATGLLRFATDQSYPDVITSAAGTATVSTTIAGALDSLTAYSVRARVAQSAINWNGTNPVACGNLARTQGG